MARVSFNKHTNVPSSPHVMTIKEKRYVTQFKKHRFISYLFGSIAVIEFIFIVLRLK